MANSNDRLNRIETLIESNARAIQALSGTITANTETTNAAIATTVASINGLVQIVTEFSIRTESRLNKLDDAITGISTTNQNLERLLEQLIRRDRNSHGDEPQV